MPVKFWRKRGGLPATIDRPQGGFDFTQGSRPPSQAPIVVRTPAQVVFPGQEEEVLEAQFEVLPDEDPTSIPSEPDIPGTGDEETPLSRSQRRFQRKQERLDTKAQREELKADQAELRQSHQERIDAARSRRKEVEGPSSSEKVGKVAKKTGLAVIKGSGVALGGLGKAGGTAGGGIGKGIVGVAKYGFRRHEEGRTERTQLRLIEARNTRFVGTQTRLPGPGQSGTGRGVGRGLRAGFTTPALMKSNVSPKLTGGAYRGPTSGGGATPVVPVSTLPSGFLPGPRNPLREEDKGQEHIKRANVVYWKFPSQDLERDSQELRNQGYKIQITQEEGGFQGLYVHPRIRLSDLKFAGYEV